MAQDQRSQSRETVQPGTKAFMDRWILLGRKLQPVPGISSFVEELEPAILAAKDGQIEEFCIASNVSSGGQAHVLTVKAHALKT